MSDLYFNEKLVKLHNNLFLSVKDARGKFIDNDQNWETAYWASKTISDKEIILEWERVWSELNSKKSPYSDRSDYVHTVLSIRNKSLSKYLLFVLEQYSNVRGR